MSKLLSGSMNQQFRGFKNIVEIKHQMKGRVRFFVPVLKNNKNQILKIKEQLEKASQIDKIQVNDLTGSIVVWFNTDQLNLETLTGVVVKLCGLEDEVQKKPVSFVNKEFKAVLDSADRAIYEKSNGIMDLNSLVTTSFLSLAVMSILKSNLALPSGISLLYWSYINMQR